MEGLFGNISNNYDDFTLFQDEAGCKESNFFYHGYLLVNNKFGREILDELSKIKGKNSKDSEITFKEIKKDDYRVPIATNWLKTADRWLQEGKIRFYILGVNKNNLKNFWQNSWRFEKNVYLKFFEIGLNSLLGWFKIDPKLYKQLRVTDIFYEHGNYDDERKDKIKWLESLSGYKHSESIHSNPKKQRAINEKLYPMSNLIQFTDVLLGVAKYSFIKINEAHIGKQKCIDNFIDIIERFNNKSAYNPNSRYYKRYALQFFPIQSDITKKEFLGKDMESIRKRDGFYNNRPTYRQKVAQNQNLKLF